MSISAWHNPAMRWPWSGIEEALRLIREDMAAANRRYDRLLDEHRAFTRELVVDMRRHAEERERAVNRRLDAIHEETQEILADQRAGRQALLQMLDRLPPAPGTA
ncbi:MAG: hypothetical protein QOE65_1470 [Solirubrobacteraceae bacterium]|nr:hypothetical protein [Solirubrobacteraceae bacterium]